MGVPNQNVGNKNSEKNCHTMEDLVDHPWTLLVHCPPVITFVQFWGSKLCKKEEVESFNGFKMTGLTLRASKWVPDLALLGPPTKIKTAMSFSLFSLRFLKKWWW